jgi:hypothetical protein
MNLTQPELLLCAAILAETDAIFYPQVDRDNHDQWSGVSCARGTFWQVGVPWSSRARTESGRKKTQLLLEGLAGRGLLTARRAKGKTTHVKLSDEADHFTRLALSLPARYWAFCRMEDIAARSTRPAKFLNDCWIWEGHIEPDQAEKNLLYDQLLPALVRGWVTSRCTTKSFVWFALTPAGWGKLDSLENEPPPKDKPAPTGGAEFKVYDERFTDAMNRRDQLPRPPGEIGHIPMCASPVRQPILPCWSPDPADYKVIG